MNCKPGDMAVVLRPTNGRPCPMTDHFVEVIGIAVPDDRGWVRLPDGQFVCFQHDRRPAWIVESASRMFGFCLRGKPFLSHFHTMWDHRLRPIRDPGEGARDETLAWKPVPLPEILPSLLPTKEQA